MREEILSKLLNELNCTLANLEEREKNVENLLFEGNTVLKSAQVSAKTLEILLTSTSPNIQSIKNEDDKKKAGENERPKSGIKNTIAGSNRNKTPLKSANGPVSGNLTVASQATNTKAKDNKGTLSSVRDKSMTKSTANFNINHQKKDSILNQSHGMKKAETLTNLKGSTPAAKLNKSKSRDPQPKDNPTNLKKTDLKQQTNIKLQNKASKPVTNNEPHRDKSNLKKHSNKPQISTDKSEPDLNKNDKSPTSNLTKQGFNSERDDEIVLNNIRYLNTEETSLSTDAPIQLQTKEKSQQIIPDPSIQISESNIQVKHEIETQDIQEKFELHPRIINLLHYQKVAEFLEPRERRILNISSKLIMKFAIQTANDRIKNEVEIFQSKLSEVQSVSIFLFILKKYSAKEISKPIDPFKLTKGAEKAVILLNDPIYSVLFKDGKVPSEDVLLPFKLYLQIINKKDVCPILSKNNNFIWSYFCSLLEQNCQDKPGNYLSGVLYENFDTSSENLYEIYKLLDKNHYKITPNYYSKLCGTTGLIVFFVKDALEYLGFIEDKRTAPNSINNLYTKCKDYLCEKRLKLADLLNKYHVI